MILIIILRTQNQNQIRYNEAVKVVNPCMFRLNDSNVLGLFFREDARYDVGDVILTGLHLYQGGLVNLIPSRGYIEDVSVFHNGKDGTSFFSRAIFTGTLLPTWWVRTVSLTLNNTGDSALLVGA